MKGHFNINYDYYTDELHFGKLSNDAGLLGHLCDALREESFIGRLIAHDVVEHSTAHRNNKSVSWENEIRAFGAISFVREGEGYDLWTDLSYMCENLNRDIKPVPFIVGRFLLKGYHVEVEFMRHLVRSGVSPKNSRNIAYQFAWGRYQKEEQFSNQQWLARGAFDFIASNIPYALKAVQCEADYCSGVSIFFDSVKHIFRWQLKRKP